MIDQELQDQIRFLVLQANNPLNKLSIEEEGLFARDWVDTDNRVDAGYRVLADETIVSAGEANHLL